MNTYKSRHHVITCCLCVCLQEALTGETTPEEADITGHGQTPEEMAVLSQRQSLPHQGGESVSGQGLTNDSYASVQLVCQRKATTEEHGEGSKTQLAQDNQKVQQLRGGQPGAAEYQLRWQHVGLRGWGAHGFTHPGARWGITATIIKSHKKVLPTTRGVGQILGWCWASVVDDGPTSAQHWANASCLLGCYTHIIW